MCNLKLNYSDRVIHKSTGATHPLPQIFLLLTCLLLSSVQLLATPWTVACQAPLSMKFSKQEHWSVDCHFLLQGIFLTQGPSLCLQHWQAASLIPGHQESPKIWLTDRTVNNFAFFWLCCMAHGISTPWPETELALCPLEVRVSPLNHQRSPIWT